MGQPTKVVDVDVEAVHGLLERAQKQLEPEDFALLKRLVESLLWLTTVVRDGRTKLARLKRLVGLSKSEKTAKVLGWPKPDGGSKEGGPEEPPDPDPGDGGGTPRSGAGSPAEKPETGTGVGDGQAQAEPNKPQKGHGRRPASAYEIAEQIWVAHESLCPGDLCPGCARGRLYEPEAAVFVRITGQAPLQARCWHCQRLRCSGCGAVYTARLPDEGQGPKFAESAVSMIALLRYGTGVPHHRLEQLQGDLQTPVPDSTQWEVVDAAAPGLKPVLAELVRQAAQGTVLHGDDSHGPVLQWMGKRRQALLDKGDLEAPERTGLHTTAVVSSIGEDRQIALFFTGRQHAGENLAALLEQRAAELGPPIHMADALAANKPGDHSVLGACCLAHGRRGIVDEVDNFPEPCKYVLEMLGQVFKVDETCKTQKLAPEERLRVHQRDSAPVMEELERWMRAQLADKLVEPNSGLGNAFNYLLKRWDRLTLFLRVAGAPLTNNIAERALKMAIRHRRNSLFYRSQHGATIGDLYMSLIHTAELCGENPFAYLTALLSHPRAVAQSPADWMPWNWRGTLARLNVRPVASLRSKVA